MQDALEEKLGAVESESGNVEMQWNDIKKCVLCALSDLVRKVERRRRKSRNIQIMTSKVDKRRMWKNVGNEEARRLHTSEERNEKSHNKHKKESRQHM